MAPIGNMSNRHALAALLLVAAGILGQAPHGAQGQGATNITAVNVMVSGIVPCAAGTNINPATVLAFPNASTQLVCGSTVVANATTSSTGVFALNLGTLANLIANTPQIANSLTNNQCRVVVTTPLAACNATQAGVNGMLTSPVTQLVNSTAACVVGAVAGQTGTAGLLSFVTGLFTMTMSA